MVQIALPVLGIGGGIGVMTGASGWDAMTLLQRVALLGGLGAGVWMLARASAHLMVPGSSPGWIRPGVAGLLSLGFFALILPFFPLDPDSIPPRLNAVCFRAAFVMSIPAAVAGYLVLRRGARFGRERLGWTLGLLAGLAGALAVQLHCPVLELSHIAFGHVLPVAIGGVAGLAAGAVIRRLEPA
jgi:hypothetical protein